MNPQDSPNPDGRRREFRRRAHGCSPRHSGRQGATGGWNVVVSRAGTGIVTLQVKPSKSVDMIHGHSRLNGILSPHQATGNRPTLVAFPRVSAGRSHPRARGRRLVHRRRHRSHTDAAMVSISASVNTTRPRRQASSHQRKPIVTSATRRGSGSPVWRRGKGIMLLVAIRPASLPSSWCIPTTQHETCLTSLHRCPFSRCPIVASVRRQVFPLEELIHLQLHQHLVPETRAWHPVGGERLLGAMPQRRQGLVGQRGAPVGQLPSSLPRLALAAALRVDSRVRLPPGLC
jgi:hypothetical protein